MSKPKPKAAQAQHAGIYKADAVKVVFIFVRSTYSKYPPKDVAESLGIANLPDAVSSALASDVEYRIHQVVEVRPGPISTT